MRKREILLLLAVFLVATLTFMISAQPPQQTNPNGLQIETAPFNSHQQNTNHTFYFHVSNNTNVLTNESATCNLDLFRKQGIKLIDNPTLSYSDGEFSVFASSGNFSELGEYRVLIDCNSSTQAGFTSYSFDVTRTGYIQTTAQGLGSLIYLVLMVSLTMLLLFVGFKLTDSDVLWVFGVFLMFISMLLMTYDFWLGYEYQLKYAGAAANTAMPEILFYLYSVVVVMGLLVAGVLLFKRLPDVIKWFKINMLKEGDEDGWNNGKF